MDVTLTNKNIAGKTICELGKKYRNGLMLDKVTREYHEIHFNRNTILNKGDVLKISGKLSHIQSAAKEIGYLDRLSSETDIIFVGFGIIAPLLVL